MEIEQKSELKKVLALSIQAVLLNILVYSSGMANGHLLLDHIHCMFLNQCCRVGFCLEISSIIQ